MAVPPMAAHAVKGGLGQALGVVCVVEELLAALLRCDLQACVVQTANMRYQLLLPPAN